MSLVFTNENTIIAAGHDCQPIIFEGSLETTWKEVRSLDDPTKRTTEAASTGGRATGGIGRLNNSEAFNMFRASDSRGLGNATPVVALAGTRVTASGTELLTIHQNTITSIRAYEGEVGEITKVSTTGVDGRLVIWDCASTLGGISQGVGRLEV